MVVQDYSHILVAEEIIPRLSRSYYFQSSLQAISNFCYHEAMRINNFGETAIDWSATIEELTQQAGLQKLTLGEWASGIPFRRLLEWHRHGVLFAILIGRRKNFQSISLLSGCYRS